MRRIKDLLLYVFGVVAYLFCGYQLFRFATRGEAYVKGAGWARLAEHPAGVVFSLVVSAAVLVLGAAAVLVIWRHRRRGGT